MHFSSDRTGGEGRLARAGVVAACAVCCGIPMLVLAGAISAGAVLTSGMVAGSLLVVFATTMALVGGRLPASADRWQLALFAIGGAASFAGIWGAANQRAQAYLMISVGIAALAAAALLSLVAVEARGCRAPAPSGDDLETSAPHDPEDQT